MANVAGSALGVESTVELCWLSTPPYLTAATCQGKGHANYHAFPYHYYICLGGENASNGRDARASA